MDFFTKEKMTFWAVAILIVLNIATLGTLWIMAGRDRGHRHDGKEHPFAAPPMMHGQHEAMPMPRPPFEMIEKELGLSAEQAAAMKKLRDAHFEKVEALTKDVEKIKGELFDLLFAENVDQTKVDEKINALSAKRGEVEKLTFNHFKDILALSNAEQKQKFRGILEGILKMPPPMQHHGDMMPPPPPGGMMPPPPPGGMTPPPPPPPAGPQPNF